MRDTERLILFHNNPPDLDKCVEIDGADLELVLEHVELTRHIQEIHSLFRILLVNAEKLTSEYIVYNYGGVFRDGEKADSDEDYYKINAYVISIISSGRALKESMDVFTKTVSDSCPEKAAYIDYDRALYDGSFAYRFIIHMRNYAQHAHLPVTCTDGVYFFDFTVILAKPHFTHKASIKEEMTRYRDEIIKLYDNNPTLSLTLTLAEFVYILLALYYRFLLSFKRLVYDSANTFSEIITRYPDNVVDGAFVYNTDDDGFIHAALVSDDSCLMIDNYLEEAKDKFEENKTEWEELKGSMISYYKENESANPKIGRLSAILSDPVKEASEQEK